MKKKSLSFYGASGQEYGFEEMGVATPWAQFAGVAVFTAPDAYGLRIIRVVELTGRDHDVRPLWALHDAERYGANAVFVCLTSDRQKRLEIVADLEAGLSPVMPAANMALAMAA